MVNYHIELQFDVDAPLARVWAAFTDGAQRSKWETSEYQIDARTGGSFSWRFPGIESQGTVDVCEPERRLVQSEGSCPHPEARQTFGFASTPSGGTRIDLLHEGLPNEEMVKSVSLAWTQALADLVVFLNYGVAAARFVCPMQHLGLWPDDRTEGLVVASVDEDGIAARAGLQPGDLLLTIGGAPVFTRPELWVMMRAVKPGDKRRVELVRDRERQSAQLEF